MAVMPPGVALARVAAAAVLANATWFSATAVLPALAADWHLSSADAAWLVVAVQIGFVAGSLGAALLNLPDRVEPRCLMAWSAVTAGLVNAALVLCDGFAPALPIRFGVGVALAGVYAPGVRLVATHFKRGRGLATGVVVGALTLGSGTPHLVRAFGSLAWEPTILATSVLSVLGALAVRGVRQGPDGVVAPKLDMYAAVRVLRRERPVQLATLGYLGHMWELYAMWSWLAVFLAAGRGLGPTSAVQVGTVTFVAIGVFGMVGAVAAGWLADRVGRTLTTAVAMGVSAGCCLASPLLYGRGLVVVVPVFCVWGATVIADSAQFSAAVIELAEPRFAGSVLALQLALGFALTIVSIRSVPFVADITGWQYAFAPLAVGPVIGAFAMLQLRQSPAALALANGRR